MVDRRVHIVRRHLRMMEELVMRKDRAAGDIRFAQERLPFGASLLHHNGLDVISQFFVMR